MKIYTARNTLIFLDILISALIIALAQTIVETPLGKAILTFSFAMLSITTIMIIFEKSSK